MLSCDPFSLSLVLAMEEAERKRVKTLLKGLAEDPHRADICFELYELSTSTAYSARRLATAEQYLVQGLQLVLNDEASQPVANHHVAAAWLSFGHLHAHRLDLHGKSFTALECYWQACTTTSKFTFSGTTETGKAEREAAAWAWSSLAMTLPHDVAIEITGFGSMSQVDSILKSWEMLKGIFSVRFLDLARALRSSSKTKTVLIPIDYLCLDTMYSPAIQTFLHRECEGEMHREDTTKRVVISSNDAFSHGLRLQLEEDIDDLFDIGLPGDIVVSPPLRWQPLTCSLEGDVRHEDGEGNVQPSCWRRRAEVIWVRVPFDGTTDYPMAVCRIPSMEWASSLLSSSSPHLSPHVLWFP